MAYTPELNNECSATLRRLAWALEVPMTTAMAKIFEHIVDTVDKAKVCSKCRDRSKCATCSFKEGAGHG